MDAIKIGKTCRIFATIPSRCSQKIIGVDAIPVPRAPVGSSRDRFFATHDSDLMDCRVDITAPAIQEFVQFGILRGEVIELPHKTLDQDRMIRQVIQNLCGGQLITFQLQC